MRIAMARGDIKLVRFLIQTLDEVPADYDFTEIYFTVKKGSRDRQFLFQKKLSTDGIVKLGPGDYQLKILPEDTQNLNFGNYKFDVQIQYRDQLKETFAGDFILKDEVTHYTNE